MDKDGHEVKSERRQSCTLGNHNALLEATYDGKGKMVILRQSANGT